VAVSFVGLAMLYGVASFIQKERQAMSDGSIPENPYSDLPFWLCRHWAFWANQPTYGMSFWVEPGPLFSFEKER
jgi:hypothetical protein